MDNHYTDRELMALFEIMRELTRAYNPVPPASKIDPVLAFTLQTVTADLEKAMSAYRAKLADLEQQQRHRPSRRGARKLAHS